TIKFPFNCDQVFLIENNGQYDYFEGRVRHPRAEHMRRVWRQVDVRFVLRDGQNPFDLSTSEFRKLYRMPQHIFFELVKVLAPFCRNLCAVGLFACGSYQRMYGRGIDQMISQDTVSMFLSEVTEAFNNPANLQVHSLPRQSCSKERTNDRLGIPRVLGFVDGTLVKIVPPTWAENRAGYPGSCHDAYIYQNSGLREEMISAYWESRCWLLGDSGYGHEPLLHIPILDEPRGAPEEVYTRRHCRDRNTVERCIGVLKARWRCLLNGRTLHCAPVQSCTTLSGNLMRGIRYQLIWLWTRVRMF
ncbi:hypothetical protein FOCC_FOCC014089, partial [Frankliniella occidentalis]